MVTATSGIIIEWMEDFVATMSDVMFRFDRDSDLDEVNEYIRDEQGDEDSEDYFTDQEDYHHHWDKMVVLLNVYADPEILALAEKRIETIRED